MSDPIGEITITPVSLPGPPLTLTTDPDNVQEAWDPRKTTEAGLEGVQTTQDWGQFAVDCFRTLSWSGNGQWLDKETVIQLREWFGSRGAQFRYEDWEGNDWTVELVPPFRAEPIFGLGQAGLYKATLTLHVLEMSLLLGEPYAGD